ncbi:NAD(P)H-dependent FMN reductase [Pseudomonas tohonis]|uniref:NAD(P)H-dependent FMN reductase n=1 Tax=Pseudomonas tohonis TaxID=2725477 RepID=A0A6J4EDE3_9PSED|nr:MULTISPECIES: NADPH-dependent FMN reductase [Pseudomonas]BBP86114.1 NAD(P)H-dependent FMN reductase [Pseudomonas sp. Pc102]BCG27660.1 NAD(P)H-dependent FMN reductase [Pseudomonas tohonis]GJN54209.1 NAD(P)H-dependent FMN reductase [Pseudomonas tohonis]
MLVVTLSGSPSLESRSAALLTRARQWLERHGVELAGFAVRDFPAEDLLHARFDSPRVQHLIEQVGRADGLLVATPVYKASFAGALKTLLDLLPERALEHKVVLPIATGGSKAHMLAVDYALRPVLTALKAEEVLHGIFADDGQVEHQNGGVQLAPSLEQRLDESLEQFQRALARRPRPLEPDALRNARWSI